jgi:hypothetical protein
MAHAFCIVPHENSFLYDHHHHTHFSKKSRCAHIIEKQQLTTTYRVVVDLSDAMMHLKVGESCCVHAAAAVVTALQTLTIMDEVKRAALARKIKNITSDENYAITTSDLTFLHVCVHSLFFLSIYPQSLTHIDAHGFCVEFRIVLAWLCRLSLSGELKSDIFYEQKPCQAVTFKTQADSTSLHSRQHFVGVQWKILCCSLSHSFLLLICCVFSTSF